MDEEDPRIAQPASGNERKQGYRSFHYRKLYRKAKGGSTGAGRTLLPILRCSNPRRLEYGDGITIQGKIQKIRMGKTDYRARKQLLISRKPD